eukprot:NODE_10548_length_283_cov_31.794872_g8780_i0.p2 GENE.NODE_10548_length_283_cov_31.794872_g8780_i0~~NODE_10548_length_283_cov_31.794872_g8780_i0.p2  ORF type:complete len:55 (-),score=6.72 NODE_10548_length_283_cov_31.794872_g8780_i0:117-257(-)
MGIFTSGLLKKNTPDTPAQYHAYTRTFTLFLPSHLPSTSHSVSLES